MDICKFADIDLTDSFFDSLRNCYSEFDAWFRRKAEAGEMAYVFKNDDNKVIDFLYVKIEDGPVSDVSPVLSYKKRLKVGTFKLISRHTRRGERFMKKIMDRAIAEDVDEIYVTIYPTEALQYLIDLFQKYGFNHIANKPHVGGHSEWVLVKDMRTIEGDILKDYPFVTKKNVNKYILSIYPLYHTKLFPDSILKTESYDLVQDISPTNGIFKIYICWMRDVDKLMKGDLLVIYRTSDNLGSAQYRSVATSVCTVEEVRTYKDFEDINDFVRYTNRYSVFSPVELQKWFMFKNNFVVIKMLYNVAFSKRVIRKDLLEQVGIPREAYWGFCKITDNQFNDIIKLGRANERYFID